MATKTKRGRRRQNKRIVEHLVARLCADVSWQQYFSDSERRVMLRMAKNYWRLQVTAGFSQDEMYWRVLRMLCAAAPDGRMPVVCAANPEAGHCVWMRRLSRESV